MTTSLQDQFAPNNSCYGCGPANQQGLQLKSFPNGNIVTGSWQPEAKYEAFPGILCGGIIGTLLDCHSNWSAAWYLMQQDELETPPCTVTANYAVKLLRPTPTSGLIHLTASLQQIEADRAIITAELAADDKICATCQGLFVAVKPGHPAYHRW